MKKQALFLSLSSLLLSSCGMGGSSVSSASSASNPPSSSSYSTSTSIVSDPASSNPSSSKTSAVPGEVASPVSADFLSFFEAGKKPQVKVSADPSVFAFLSEYQSDKDSRYVDIYVPADVTIVFGGKDYSFPEAGIRVKGNMSRVPFFEGNQFIDFTHFKINLKATFDDEVYSSDSLLQKFRKDWSQDPNGRKKRKDRNFFGLEKLDLKFIPRNGVSKMAEVYAYKAFSEQGILAPYSTLGSLTLTAGSATITSDYEIIETIDKAFLKRRFSKDEAKGDLYKCVYNQMGKADFSRSGAVYKETGTPIKNGKIGVEDNYRYYAPVYQLKTNDDAMQDSDFTRMGNLLYGVWDCVYGNGTMNTLESLVDVDEFLRFAGISFLLGNFDDQRYNSNNFYVYFRPSDGRAMFLPYDWDWALGNDRGANLASKGPLDGWTLDGGTNSNIYQATLVGQQPKYDRSGYQNRYLAYIQQVKDQVLNPSAYRTLAGKFGLTNDEETSIALEYMQEKLRHCA